MTLVRVWTVGDPEPADHPDVLAPGDLVDPLDVGRYAWEAHRCDEFCPADRCPGEDVRPGLWWDTETGTATCEWPELLARHGVLTEATTEDRT